MALVDTELIFDAVTSLIITQSFSVPSYKVYAHTHGSVNSWNSLVSCTSLVCVVIFWGSPSRIATPSGLAFGL